MHIKNLSILTVFELHSKSIYNLTLRSFKLTQAKKSLYARNSRKENIFIHNLMKLWHTTQYWILVEYKNNDLTPSPILQHFEDQLFHVIQTPQIY